MSQAQRLLTIVSLLGACFSTDAPGAEAKATGKNLTATERDVRAFYDSYAQDLREHRREAIVDRYDPRGVYLLGYGKKTFSSIESIRTRYQGWTGPKTFEWLDLSVDVLSPDAAIVLGRFDWVKDTGDTLTFSYTGLLIRHQGKWRIRVEDESK